MKEYIIRLKENGQGAFFDLENRREVIHCCECVYYDPPHVFNEGRRIEYKDLPVEAFDLFGILVNSEYGINIGGRCCKDYNVGYLDDKRVFVSADNYCGRAEKRQEEIKVWR